MWKSASRWLLILMVLGGLWGCQSPLMKRPSPTAAGLDPAEIQDAQAEREVSNMVTWNQYFDRAEDIRKSIKQNRLEQMAKAGKTGKKTILALSGGGSLGAYTAGVLYGWTQTGQRPNFDVVTGVSTGSLIGAIAFLGPEYDEILKRSYTTITNDDVLKRKFILTSILSDSLASNAPLLKTIESIITPEYIVRVIAEHAKGRRLYVGTTELESRRHVVWDMGEIATRHGPNDRELFCRILLASAAIPGFFPPVEIPITVNGETYYEKHIDGGVSAAVFARPPYSQNPTEALNTDTGLYVIIAGKLYATPSDVKMRALSIASTAISAMTYTQTRDELFKMYTACLLTGTDFKYISLNKNYSGSEDATKFEPAEMTKLFEEGRRQIQAAESWRTIPPGRTTEESPDMRYSTMLEGGAPLKVKGRTQMPFDGTQTLPPGTYIQRNN
ncbi:patatin : Patatin OS=Burkholderia phymatum (strain DSM 17167 / STM815) GN=Bphy_6656 PE=4 SV=1: Patatin [Tuwongella immobilis]|uniref:PNPLA domain-containing protein n=2 Tax=Tuwongella immobilis TaxID=692036 RepID=A0A6C2YTD6_9BACT|nr:patatin : Patatin OS=Burkholderia phymatum (strain DSM 17167 / STM815) GN=Bphy_6656 PE=4 SV=1: Patatin [Tuwongella immobilis]VTS06707.1 patatin : Patatin OS=Burkholderia phymatum (strain DSM 17167 / STM815) GN=Bphy_6656 PE=4 SV=1: Patatin [Tuwongella immobilis]